MGGSERASRRRVSVYLARSRKRDHEQECRRLMDGAAFAEHRVLGRWFSGLVGPVVATAATHHPAGATTYLFAFLDAETRGCERRHAKILPSAFGYQSPRLRVQLFWRVRDVSAILGFLRDRGARHAAALGCADSAHRRPGEEHSRSRGF